MLHVCVSKEAKVGVRFLEVHAVLAQPDMGAGDEAAVHIPDSSPAVGLFKLLPVKSFSHLYRCSLVVFGSYILKYFLYSFQP